MLNVRSVIRSVAEHVLVQLPRRTSRGDRLVLAYHNIVPDTWAAQGDRSLHLAASKFETQLQLIRLEAEIVPLWELLTTDVHNSRRVAITFDDAYTSALEIGVAVCQRENAPCTIFVAPDLIGKVPYWDRAANNGIWTASDRHRFLWSERGREGISTSEVPGVYSNPNLTIASETLLSSTSKLNAVTYGNHTTQHPNLGALSEVEVRDEIEGAHTWLMQRFQASYIPVVAYPYGIPSVEVSNTLSHTGIRFGLLVAGGWVRKGVKPDAYMFPRWNVPAGISNTGFRLRLRGWLSQ